MKGKLFLIPSTIGDTQVDRVIPVYIKELIKDIRIFIVENERSVRRMLIKLGISTPIDEIQFLILNKHTPHNNIPGFLSSIQNENIGLMSEAGVPAVADPGSVIVDMAHKKGIRVIPLVGPSSILLAMMASGLNGQNFAFNGYLAIKHQERIRQIKNLEQRSESENQSQIFIEAPYRNNQLLKDIINNCSAVTQLCIASEITTDKEFINTKSIEEWRTKIPDLHKKPVIYILHKKNR
ncbi:MAG: SAM-dependent methyltransferase [Bacteroidales bacterium]|nr:SAM-dependent methyltransferase [Bacteroidales bacterium]